jgi:flagellar biosynthesis/type III secretory pathway chaperone
MDAINKAENKLQEFIDRWQKFYKLTDTDVINLLSGQIIKTNNKENKTTNQVIYSVHDKVIYEEHPELNGIKYVKINDKYVYISPKIDDYLQGR